MLLLKQISSQKLVCDENALKFQPNGCSVANFYYRTSTTVQYVNIQKTTTSLEIQNSDMETIPIDLFTNYPNLQLLGIQNSKLQYIQKGNFKNAGNLQTTGFSQNNLTIIKNSTFEGCTALISLVISNEANLKTLEVGAFRGLSVLLQLTITFGSIEALQPGIFDDLTSLTLLALDNQKLLTIPLNLFLRNPKIYSISIANNQITTIPAKTFNGISKLQQLNLSNNQLQKSPSFNAVIVILSGNILKKVHISSMTVQVDVSNNSITAMTCDKAVAVITLTVSNNQMRGLQCISKMVNLVNLDLSNNRFTGLSKAKISKLAKLQYLKLDENNFKKLKPVLLNKNKQLVSLQVDKLANYKPLKRFFPNLIELVLSTQTWNCTQVQAVADTLRPQNISIELNGEYTNFKSFKCQTSSNELNNPGSGLDFSLF